MYNDSNTMEAFCCSFNNLGQMFLTWERVSAGQGEDWAENLFHPSVRTLGLRVGGLSGQLVGREAGWPRSGIL